MNKDEYGYTIRVNLREDISSATSYQILLQPKQGAEITKTATLGTSNITENNEAWVANEYLEYVVADGDIDKAGEWRKKGKAVISSTNIKIGNYERFTVLE